MENYLGYPILACCGDWIIVDDCKYNYYLFKFDKWAGVIREYMKGGLPYNRVDNKGTTTSHWGSYKVTEFYTDFDIAVKNMCKCKANNGFFSFRKVTIGHP